MKIASAIALVAVLFSVETHAEDKAALSFYELHGDKQEAVSIERWKGEPLLVAFWRSDCAPCLQEMKLLPEIANENSDLAIALISLHDAAHTRSHLPALPKNVHTLVANDDGKKVLASFGNDRTLALPYSVMLNKKNDVCGKHYGIVSPDKIKEWRKEC